MKNGKIEVDISNSEKYRASLDAHKHYDNISLALTPGIVLIPMGAIHFAGELEDFEKPLAMLFGCVITVAIFLIYRQASSFASIARQVSAAIESGKFKYDGPSSVFTDPRKPIKPHRGFTYRIVLSVTAISVLCMVAYAIQILRAA